MICVPIGVRDTGLPWTMGRCGTTTGGATWMVETIGGVTTRGTGGGAETGGGGVGFGFWAIKGAGVGRGVGTGGGVLWGTIALALGGVGEPAGGLLPLPQWKMRVDIARGLPDCAGGPEPTIVINSPLSTACTWKAGTPLGSRQLLSSLQR